MKNLTKLTYVFAMIFVFSISCEKEENNTNSLNNSIKYGGQNYSISWCIMESPSSLDSGEGYRIDLFILSSGIQIDESSDSSFKGEGNGIEITLFSNSDYISDGDYNYTSEPDNLVGTCGYGSIILNANIDTGTGEEINISNGNLNVNKEGSQYIFNFEGKMANGESISFNYTGNIDLFQ